MNKEIAACIAGVIVSAVASAAQAQTAAPPAAAANPQADSTATAPPAAASPTGAGLGDIVVTARKRAESQQKVPISITVFTGADLEARSVHRFTDLTQTTAGLVITKQTSDPNSPIVQIRGQKQDTVQVATEPSVGLYLDGVYSGGSLGNNIGDLIDIDRIEVLKGPQGTLYGRNTTGGAINIYSKVPTDRLEGQVGIGIGNYNRRSANAILNLPIDGDDVDLRLVGSIVTHDGYGKQKILAGANQPIVGQQNPLSQNIKALRGTLKIKPAEGLQILLRGDYSHSNDSGIANHPIYIQPTNATVLTAAAIQITGKAAAAITAADRANALAIMNNAVNSDPLDVYNAYRGSTSGSTTGASATISYDFGGATIKSISAYRHARTNRFVDDCGCGIDLLDFHQMSSFNMFTQELQLVGTTLDSRLKYTFGAYYFHKTGRNNESTIAFAPLKLAINPTVNAYVSQDTSLAAYSQATFAVTPTVNLTGGLRYTKEKRTLVANDFNAVACQLPAANLIFPPAVLLPNCQLSNFKKDQNVSYTAGLDWTPVRDVLLYVKTNRGFQAGGVNLRPNTNPASVVTYRPEVVTDYEIGLKSEWLDRHLRLNVDYYHSKLADAQRNILVSPPPPIIGIGTLVLTNAASATIDGVEAELSAIPFAHAYIGLTGAWTDPKYTKYVVGGIDQSFLNFQVTPKWSYTATAAYTAPTGIGNVKGEVDWSWRSSYDLYPQDTPGAVNGISAAGVATVGAGTPDAFRIQKGYGLLNASLSVTVDRLNMDIRLFVTNLIDKRYFSYGLGTINGGTGITSAIAGDPRTFGIDLVKRF
jgi:iron complex outermembrane receptor protein